MGTDLTASFQQAIEDSKGLTERPSNDTLLQLYSFYKQATEGDAPGENPGTPFDFVAKAKYEAWNALRGRTKDLAMKDYIDLVNKLKN